MEGFQTRGERALAEASYLLGYKESNNMKYKLVYTDYYSKTNGVGRDNIEVLHKNSRLQEKPALSIVLTIIIIDHVTLQSNFTSGIL